MTQCTAPKKASRQDWHPAQVIAELRMRAGLTLSQLAKRHGVARQQMSRALHHPYPRSEARIAAAIGLAPKTIWPSRYHADGSVIERRGQPSHKAKDTAGGDAVKVNSRGRN